MEVSRQPSSRTSSLLGKGDSFFVWIEKPKGWKIRAGDSISISGVCSTVRSMKSGRFEVEYMPETLSKTTVGNFEKGMIVNLERSLRLNDLVDGHLVLGHVDCVGRAIDVKSDGGSKVMRIKVPKKFLEFIAPKGSVAIDGISLTVVDMGKDWFTVSLVSYTLENTNLISVKAGQEVNIEVDIIAKYVNRMLVNKL